MQYSSNRWYNEFDVDGSISALTGNDYAGLNLPRKTELVPLNNIRCVEEALDKYAPLAAIVMKMSEMFANGKFEVLNRRTQNYTRGNYKEWDDLLANPNFLQTRTEFLKQLYSFVLLNGWCYALPIYASGFTDRPIAIFLLPPWMVEVEPVNKAPHKVKKGESFRKIYVRWGQVREEIDESKLILFKDSAAVTICHKTFLPEGRIKHCVYPLSNGIGSEQSRNSLIHDRGASGILANTGSDVHGAMPIDDDEITRLAGIYKSRYGLTPDKAASIIITSAALKWQPMTFNVKDLMLHEEDVKCTQKIADVFGYKSKLLSIEPDAKYENSHQYKQEVYHDSIIPQATALIEQLNVGLKTPDVNIEIVMSYEHVPVLQKSEKEKGEGRKAMNDALEIEFRNSLITRNMWLETIGRDTVAKPEFDLYLYEMTPEQRGMIMQTLNDNNDGEKGKEE